MSELRDKVEAALRAHADMGTEVARAADDLVIASAAEKVAHLARLAKAKADLEPPLEAPAA